ncbi:MAG: putative 2-aminoethylphosphonate ABC transporter ATP-binding protein [Burkholderiales bacterium]
MNAPRAEALRIEHVSKRFGSFTALEDINLTVQRGELICFLGPSGCGKTTLLRIIAGLETQSAGAVIQYGKDISRLPPMQRDYGIVFQSYALFPNLTVYDNVAYGLVSRKFRKDAIAARVAELLALVSLPESGDRYPNQLSGGQQQRIALARALATSPGLLLLDEPLSALDARVRVRLRSEIRVLQRRLAVTTILVTHDQEEALSMADRIVVMNNGTIEQVGTPDQVYLDPASPFVADFVGKTNLLPATLVDGAGLRIGTLVLSGVSLPSGMPSGTAVSAFTRPEDVVVRSEGETLLNSAPGRIENIEFLGAHCRLAIRVEGIEGCLVYADFSLRGLRSHGLDTGKAVRVALPSERVRVFAARGAPTAIGGTAA